MARPTEEQQTLRDEALDHIALADNAAEAMEILLRRGLLDHAADLEEAALIVRALLSYKRLAQDHESRVSRTIAAADPHGRRPGTT
jgi:hypothetical protein